MTADMRLTIDQVVRDAPSGEVRYHIAIDHGVVRVQEGASAAPDVTLFTGYDIASAIARGTANAQDALVRGQFKVTGRLDRLLAHAPALGALEDVFAAVRATTTYLDGA